MGKRHLVAPLAGARIEIEESKQIRTDHVSLPSRERGLKSSAKLKIRYSCSRSPRGSAD